MKDVSGLLLIDKQQGPTSADIVRSISRLIGKRHKIGHAGTLDPDATGLLVILIGGATRLSDFVMELPKIYEAVVRFGIETDSYDSTGKIVSTADASSLTQDDVAGLLPRFEGKIMQRPPVYSAVKLGGKRAYKLARRGELGGVDGPQLAEREAIIHEIRLESFENNLRAGGSLEEIAAGNRDIVVGADARIFVRCGKGTYLRTLAHDMGAILGLGAHIKKLRRLGIGPFTPDIKVDELTVENWTAHLINGARIFEDVPLFEFNSRGALNLRRGLPIKATDFVQRPTEPVGARTGIIDEEGRLIAVAKIGIGGTLIERKILDPL